MQEKNMIFLKKKHVIPKQGGGGGVPHLGKIPTFSRFFFWQRPYDELKLFSSSYIFKPFTYFWGNLLQTAEYLKIKH